MASWLGLRMMYSIAAWTVLPNSSEPDFSPWARYVRSTNPVTPHPPNPPEPAQLPSFCCFVLSHLSARITAASVWTLPPYLARERLRPADVRESARTLRIITGAWMFITVSTFCT